jgi:methyl coenzyme M reductase subunit C
MTGGLANIRTVEIGADTMGKVLDHLLCQTSIGTGGAGCCAQDAGFDTLCQLCNLYLIGLWMGRQHLTDRMAHCTFRVHGIHLSYHKRGGAIRWQPP